MKILIITLLFTGIAAPLAYSTFVGASNVPEEANSAQQLSNSQIDTMDATAPNEPIDNDITTSGVEQTTALPCPGDGSGPHDETGIHAGESGNENGVHDGSGSNNGDGHQKGNGNGQGMQGNPAQPK